MKEYYSYNIQNQKKIIWMFEFDAMRAYRSYLKMFMIM